MSLNVFTVCPQLIRPCHMTFLAVTSTYPNICHWRSEDEGVLILCEALSVPKQPDKNSSSGLRLETGIRGNIGGKCINKTIKKEKDAKERKYFVFV